MPDTHHTDSKDDPKNPTKFPLQLSEYYERDFIGSKDELQDAIKFIAHHIWLHGNNVGKHPEAYKNIASEKVDELRYGQKFINDLITAEVRKAEDALLENVEKLAKERVDKMMGANIHILMFSYEDISGLLAAALKAERNGREKA